MELRSAQRLAEVVAEIKRREQKHVSFVDPNFPKQREILEDHSRFQAWLCTRRGAKSTTFAKKCATRLVRDAGAKGVYLALTQDSAKDILWDIMAEQLDAQKVPHTPRRQMGIFDFGNGSRLRFFGVDASYKLMKRVLGTKLSITGIDEAGSMTIDMETLCYQMIRPALSDLYGDLIMLGTCENIPNTFHQKVTDGKEPGWKVHKWTTYENPYMAKQWTEEITDITLNNPLALNASWFRTHYMNEWCADDDLLIYKISDYNLQFNPPNKMMYVMGVDLGFNDDSSFTVYGWSFDNPNLYMLESFKCPGMDFTDTANQIKKLLVDYPDAKIIIDGANKQGVEEMRKRHALHLESAEKQDKATFMRMFADDLIQGRVLIKEEKSKAFIDECAQLMWLKDTDKEDPRCANHATDSALYAWRYAKNYTFQPEVTKWSHPNEAMIQQFQDEARRAQMEMEEENY